MSSQQVSPSPCSSVWLLNAALQLVALVVIRAAAQDISFKVPQHAVTACHQTPEVQRLRKCNAEAACPYRPCCDSCMHTSDPIHHYVHTVSAVAADHWQNKLYPYGSTQTLGDGILGTIGISTHYYWCWVAIGVCLAYILLFNVIIVILLTVLPRKFVFPSTLSVVMQQVLIWSLVQACGISSVQLML